MDDASVQAICELFDLGAPRGEPAPTSGGLTNRMWRLATVRGVFAVKQMNRDFDQPDYIAWHDRAFILEQACFAAGVPMPRPIPVAATGRCLGELPGSDGRPMTVRVHTWVDGVKLDNAVAYPVDDIARVGAILARVHALRMTPDVTPSEALRVFGQDHWRERLERLERDGGEWGGQLFGLLEPLRALEMYLTAAHADPTPLVLSHRDSDMKNFLRTPSGDLLLVDWDGAGPVNPRQDLANEALVWAGVHRGDPDPEAAQAFVAAYRRGGGVNEPFHPTDIAELVAVRLGWFDFNLRRALGERVRDAADREVGASVVRSNLTQLPRFARSLDAWLAALRD